MNSNALHTFHIPVMGLAFTVDTPLKVAKYGINSVISIIQDELLEQMREFHSTENNIEYIPILKSDVHHRSLRVKAYLNLIHDLVEKQWEKIQNASFDDSDLQKYFKMLPESSSVKQLYNKLNEYSGEEKSSVQQKLKSLIRCGSIDVNIMSKIDNSNYDRDKNLLPVECNDAIAAFIGFAESKLSASLILSAGLNAKMFAFIEKYDDFFPNSNGFIKKKLVIKVSDFRSASIQGKMYAKKGIWISEFRIESGLNCGGHAFPTEGKLLGPVLEEFKNKREELCNELKDICNKALIAKGKLLVPESAQFELSAQGGIGNYNEDTFLRNYYQLNSSGWGSPFLLVPEATNVDDNTLQQLISAKEEDYFLSKASPLGVLFNNFKLSSANKLRLERIQKGKPGSPCFKKFLSFSTEFTERPICTASHKFQKLKLASLNAQNLPPEELEAKTNDVLAKECLCDGLSTSAIVKNGMKNPIKCDAISICPGPNLSYFNKITTLEEMCAHIYGKINILSDRPRPHMFIKELSLYIDYLKTHVMPNITTDKLVTSANEFKENLIEGVNYYRDLFNNFNIDTSDIKNSAQNELQKALNYLSNLQIIPAQTTVGA